MCGISGFSLGPDELVNSKRLAKGLLLGIEHRGKDSTGFAFVDPTGMVQVHKAPVPASDFVRRRLCIPRRARLAICHTRAATQGKPEFNENNHPVEVERLVGVHNGMLSNDGQVFRELGLHRPASVDSAAIFAALSVMNPKDALEYVEGSVATAWLDRSKPEVLHIARGASSPLVVAHTKGGSLIFASEEAAVSNACLFAGLEIDHIEHIREGVGFDILDGSPIDSFTFTPEEGYSRYTWHDYRPSRIDYTTYQPSRPFGVPTAPRSLPAGATWSDVTESVVDRAAFSTMNNVALSQSAHNEVYAEREQAITAHLLRKQEIAAGDAERERESRRAAFQDLHAGLQVGDVVMTYLNGEEAQAQVVKMPNKFPGGSYVLRVAVPAEFREAKHELVLVQRWSDEFVSFAWTENDFTPTSQLVLDVVGDVDAIDVIETTTLDGAT